MSSLKKKGYIWLDGNFVGWKDAKIHVLTHTFHYGMGVFEGIRAYKTKKGPAIFRLDDHIQRWYQSAHIMSMSIPFDKNKMRDIHKECVTKNNLKSAYIRPVCYYGDEDIGLQASNLKEHVMIAAWEWGSYLGDENIKKGIKIKTSSYVRQHVNSSMCKAKVNGYYANSMLALKEAQIDGYDETLFLDAQSYVAEGSGENVFIIKDGILYTPNVTSILAGITRATIIEIAQNLGYKCIEKNITRDEFYCCDEAFFTGTAAEVTPIISLDSRKIKEGTPGDITKKLQSLYFECVTGENNTYGHWLTYL